MLYPLRMENFYFDISQNKNSPNLTRWAANKNPLCALLAIQSVASAESIHGMILSMHTFHHPSKMTKEDIDQWMQLYKQPKSVYKAVLTAFQPHEDTSPFFDSQSVRVVTKASLGKTSQKKRLQNLFENADQDQLENEIATALSRLAFCVPH